MLIDMKQLNTDPDEKLYDKYMSTSFPTIDSIELNFKQGGEYTFTQDDDGNSHAEVPLGAGLRIDYMPSTAKAKYTNADEKEVKVYWVSAKHSFDKTLEQEQALIPTIEYGNYIPQGAFIPTIFLTPKDIRTAKSYEFWMRSAYKDTYQSIKVFSDEMLETLESEMAAHYISSARAMFADCASLKELPPGMDFSKATNISSLFFDCHSLREFPDNYLSFPAATNAESAFRGLTIQNIDFDKVNLPSATQISYLFENTWFINCSGTLSLPAVTDANFGDLFKISGGSPNDSISRELPLVEMQKATDIAGLFEDSRCLKANGIIAPEATNCSALFSCNSKVKEIERLDLPKVQNYEEAFKNCSELTSLPTLDMTNVTNVTKMFAGCSKLPEARFKNVPESLVPSLTHDNLMESYVNKEMKIVIENTI